MYTCTYVDSCKCGYSVLFRKGVKKGRYQVKGKSRIHAKGHSVVEEDVQLTVFYTFNSIVGLWRGR